MLPLYALAFVFCIKPVSQSVHLRMTPDITHFHAELVQLTVS